MVLGLLRSFHRRRLAARPLPDGWRETVHAWLPFSRALDDDERSRFEEHLAIFFHEKRFEGVGLEVTDEMRVVLSGVAARLSRNVGFEVYDDLGSVVLYPTTVSVPRRSVSGVDRGPVVEEGSGGALGLAHPWGTVVLAWDAVERGLKNPDDGHDTALHELAHIIDMADGAADGTPILDGGGAYRDWARVLSAHYERLRKRPSDKVLRAYGATNEAEFFAVASEAFFEKPRSMQRRHPELFEVLADYYKVKPTGARRQRPAPKAKG